MNKSEMAKEFIKNSEATVAHNIAHQFNSFVDNDLKQIYVSPFSVKDLLSDIVNKEISILNIIKKSIINCNFITNTNTQNFDFNKLQIILKHLDSAIEELDTIKVFE